MATSRPYRGNRETYSTRYTGRHDIVRKIYESGTDTYAALHEAIVSLHGSTTTHPESSNTIRNTSGEYFDYKLAEIVQQFLPAEVLKSVDLPQPCVTAYPETREIWIPIAASYADGTAVVVHPDNRSHILQRKAKISVTHLKMREDDDGTWDNAWVSNAAAAKISNAAWYGFTADEVLYHGPESTVYLTGLNWYQTFIWHHFEIRHWIEYDPGVSPHASIDAVFDAITDNRYEIQVTTPGTATLPTPL